MLSSQVALYSSMTFSVTVSHQMTKTIHDLLSQTRKLGNFSESRPIPNLDPRIRISQKNLLFLHIIGTSYGCLHPPLSHALYHDRAPLSNSLQCLGMEQTAWIIVAPTV